MIRTILALFAIVMVSGCAACDPKPNPCDNNPCGEHGNCRDDNGKAVCDCQANWHRAPACDFNFDPQKQGVARKIFCQSSQDGGQLLISGITEPAYAMFNGYTVDVDPNTFTKCVLLVVDISLDTNAAVYDSQGNRIGSTLDKYNGIKVWATDMDNPELPGNGDGNVTILKKLHATFKDYRGTVVALNPASGHFELSPAFSITGKGTLGDISLGTYSLYDTKPVISASASQDGGTNVTLDFTGTTDEQSGTPYFLSFSASAGGIPLTLTSSGDHRFQTTLPGGIHSIILKVLDPNRSEDTKTVTLTVDLCTGNACPNWQTCREADGVCVGSNPCVPNPCLHGGICSPTGTATYLCSCITGNNWTGPICSICPAGFYEDGTGSCVTDNCFGKTCDDGDLCNGPETCDRATGCVAGTPLTCNDGLVCNGTEMCNPTAGCINPPDVNCNSHGTCQEPSGTCQCTGDYDPATNCVSCLSGKQDNDGNGICQPACAAGTCNSHGSCNDTSGTATCTCNPNWNPANSCNSCVTGYQDNDNNGLCQPACSSGTCNGRGTCSDTTGTAVCVSCTGDYDSATNCVSCLSGKQDNDGNGVCLPACNSGTCSGHGTCSDTTGMATCVSCDAGYNLAQSCSACSSGYIGYPTCVDNPCDPDPCNGRGTCSTANGSCTSCTGNWNPATQCSTCNTGWRGPTCATANSNPTVTGLGASPNPFSQYGTTTISATYNDADGDTVAWELTLANPNGGSLGIPSNGTCDTATHCFGSVPAGTTVTAAFNAADQTNATATVTANDGYGGTGSAGPYVVQVQ